MDRGIKRFPYKLLSVCLLSAALAACTADPAVEPGAATQLEAGASTAGQSVELAATGGGTNGTVEFDEDDSYTDWTKESPNYIQLEGNTAKLQGTGAVLTGNQITIALPGVYVLSGTWEDGQIVVDLESKGNVRLVLNGVELNSSDSAAIYVKNAKKTIISLQDGTENTVSDGEEYVLADGEDEPNAAIFSKDDLTINGTGTLTVHGNYNNGIMSKDNLKIAGGHIVIESVDDGLVGRDMVAVKDVNLNIDASGDGIRSTNNEDAAKGFIALAGGTYNITAGADGIQAVTSVLITGGRYTLATGGGSGNGTKKADEMPQGGGGRGGGFGQSNQTSATAAVETSSAKGIKAGTAITISGGTFHIDSSDDTVHSNGNVTIAGGELSLSSGDDGVHADAALTIQDGVINITKSYEGIESKLITIAGGETRVTASDDGVNVAGGNDGSSVNGRPGQNTFSASGDSKLLITGGYLSVDASGDGLDSNGSIAMSGGTVVVSGPTNSGNGALDYDGSFELTGGVLVAAGSSGMAQAPSEQSSQYSIMMSFAAAQQANTLVALTDSDNRLIAAFVPKKQFQTVVVTSPDLKQDGTYTFYTGGTVAGTATDGLYTEGEYQAGTKIVSFPAATPVTYVSESGVTTGRTGNQGGGRMNPGGAGGMGQGGMGQGQGGNMGQGGNRSQGGN
ncbi:MAG: dockerin type 1 [Paenibacillaceae bacterium]|jgi:hypothetical protein|nr:dockerin type 1 [Paenibacillaceae bacterium]